jgi:hypothetical protein
MKKILCLFTSHPFLAGLLMCCSVVFIGLPTQAQRLVIVSDYADPTFKLEDNGLPKEWSIKVWEGIPEIMVMQDNQQRVLQLRSHHSSISLYRELEFQLDQTPFLNWEWKVNQLPENADARTGDRDDQAAGIYVVFPRFPAFLNSQLLGYIWDNTAPEGTIVPSSNNSLIQYIVVRSGSTALGKWMKEKRNVLADYQQVFGDTPPAVGGVSLMIDSDDTNSQAESFFREVVFQSEEPLLLLQR